MPTSTIGTFFDWDRISGIHFSLGETSRRHTEHWDAPDVLECGRHDDTEAEEEDVSVGVDEGAERVKVVLARGVAELEGEGLAVYVDHGVVGVDGGGDVLRGVTVSRVGDDQAGLPHRAVPDEHALWGG